MINNVKVSPTVTIIYLKKTVFFILDIYDPNLTKIFIYLFYNYVYVEFSGNQNIDFLFKNV